jgi:8-oxo-dGTP diphosphatase
MKLGTLCYIRKDGRTLMLHRVKKEKDFHEGKWNGLGGKLHPGETPDECAVREVKEESGLDVEALALKGVITFPMFDGVDDWYVFVYVITAFRGSLIDSPEGNLAWIEDGRLFDLNLWPGDRIFMEWLDSRPFFSAKFIYENKQFISHSVVFY